MKKKTLIVHPILFATYPIIFFYSHNINEMTIGQIFIPMAISFVSLLILWAVLNLILKNKIKAGVVTTLFVILFFTYGHFYSLLESWKFFVPKHRHLIPGLLLGWGYAAYFIKLSRWDFKTISRLLNITAIVLVTMNLVNIAVYGFKNKDLVSGNLEKNKPLEATSLNSPETEALPDIYYIILDEYASLSTIEEIYGYDNSEFANNLINKGFYIAEKSITKTPSSDKSIASSLNMEYISNEVSLKIIYEKISNNKVANFLKQHGYKYIYFGNWYDVDRWKSNADLYFNYYESSYGGLESELSRVLLTSTVAKPFYDYFAKGRFENFYRRAVKDTFEHLKKIPDEENPKFVFAHIDSPHTPFVFGPTGEKVDPSNWSCWKDKQFYLDQYIFISKQIEELVDVLLKRSKKPAIIIIQSDHGPRAVGEDDEVDLGDSWKSIFNAYYLPDKDKRILYDNISPVNTFRLIFNHYFDADYDLPED